MRRPSLIVAIATTAALALTACGSKTDETASETTLVLYNAQHEEVGKMWADGFTAKTGIKVEIRNGSDFELANQIVAEGGRSPADVFITENSPAMSLVSSKDLFAPVDAATKGQVPAQYSSSKGDWVGVAARSTVFVYGTAALTEAQLPKSILDLAKPEWKGRFGVSPSGADFQAIVSAVYALVGDQAGAAWLQGIKDNAKIYRGNSAIMKAANSGEVPGGVIYHYYWYGDQADGGANSNKTKLAFLGNQDPGAFVSVSGGGVLKASKHATEAQQLLAYMTSPEGQKALADSTAFEYSVGTGVASNAKLKPLAELGAPTVDLNTLNGPKIISEMQRVGLL
ncbi:iron(III) transport system substrate-binding protein [Asanoa ferruginea]|uniref:Iron(III) transport system substrate-binding protein n=1 Tax=Asanoa ferruginea TaxID=53367 RepID=A0A3D9ZPQ8_9ACTN|nr:iron ABC transporter substrate-binding protein [Asanoa ferruginea]REF99251.1 iron(III) transport system substrate-binding protein [Asanoa ferruginea]GIF45849.1 iron ABC transporter substrate-binding protein [Asanoa ferruginea]